MDTGLETLTGGRLRRVRRYLDKGPFFFTYGDGLADVDIQALLKFHKKSRALATVTAVQAPGRFGSLVLEGERASFFHEKPAGDGAWINGGFFVLEPEAIDYVEGDAISWEREPLERLARDRKLAAYRHHGFWQPMDTLRDKLALEQLWEDGPAPWKVWK